MLHVSRETHLGKAALKGDVSAETLHVGVPPTTYSFPTEPAQAPGEILIDTRGDGQLEWGAGAGTGNVVGSTEVGVNYDDHITVYSTSGTALKHSELVISSEYPRLTDETGLSYVEPSNDSMEIVGEELVNISAKTRVQVLNLTAGEAAVACVVTDSAVPFEHSKVCLKRKRDGGQVRAGDEIGAVVWEGATNLLGGVPSTRTGAEIKVVATDQWAPASGGATRLEVQTRSSDDPTALKKRLVIDGGDGAVGFGDPVVDGFEFPVARAGGATGGHVLADEAGDGRLTWTKHLMLDQIDMSAGAGDVSITGGETIPTLPNYTGDGIALQHGTPSAAYALRRLFTAYDGPCVRVWDSVAAAEVDLGWNETTGFIDSTAVTALPAEVRVWYDQSGNGRDMTGEAVGATGVMPMLNHDGTSHSIAFSESRFNTALTAFELGMSGENTTLMTFRSSDPTEQVLVSKDPSNLHIYETLNFLGTRPFSTRRHYYHMAPAPYTDGTVQTILTGIVPAVSNSLPWAGVVNDGSGDEVKGYDAEGNVRGGAGIPLESDTDIIQVGYGHDPLTCLKGEMFELVFIPEVWTGVRSAEMKHHFDSSKLCNASGTMTTTLTPTRDLKVSGALTINDQYTLPQDSAWAPGQVLTDISGDGDVRWTAPLGDGHVHDQSLNTTDDVHFENLDVTTQVVTPSVYSPGDIWIGGLGSTSLSSGVGELTLGAMASATLRSLGGNVNLVTDPLQPGAQIVLQGETAIGMLEADRYTLPSDKTAATVGDVMTYSAAGEVTFQPLSGDGHTHDQSLNTTDDVTFSNINMNAVFGNALISQSGPLILTSVGDAIRLTANSIVLSADDVVSDRSFGIGGAFRYDFPSDRTTASNGDVLVFDSATNELKFQAPPSGGDGHTHDQVLDTTSNVTFNNVATSKVWTGAGELRLEPATVVSIPTSDLVLGATNAIHANTLFAPGANLDLISAGDVTLASFGGGDIKMLNQVTFGNSDPYTIPQNSAGANNGDVLTFDGTNVIFQPPPAPPPPTVKSFSMGHIGSNPQTITAVGEIVNLDSEDVTNSGGNITLDLANNTVTLAAGGYYELSAIFGGFMQDPSFEVEVKWYDATTDSQLPGIASANRAQQAVSNKVSQPHARAYVDTTGGAITAHLKVETVTGTPAYKLWAATSQFSAKEL